VDRDDIRAFVDRDRTRVETAKRQHHARRFRESNGTAGVEAGSALWEYARRVRPDWPTARDRHEDLAHHIALKQRLDRAAHGFSRR